MTMTMTMAVTLNTSKILLGPFRRGIFHVPIICHHADGSEFDCGQVAKRDVDVRPGYVNAHNVRFVGAKRSQHDDLSSVE